jgi:hypothetical protein
MKLRGFRLFPESLFSYEKAADGSFMKVWNENGSESMAWTVVLLIRQGVYTALPRASLAYAYASKMDG